MDLLHSLHYKGKISFFYLNKFPITVEYNFFYNQNTESPSDAETGLISMKLSNATKSRRAIIQNASDMHTFLTETNGDGTKKIFKLVQSDGLKPLMDEFHGVEVSTLHGTCTRSLHQIKCSNQKGYILQRPFSCFCTNCTKEDFADCEKKGFTNGKFSEHKLPSNVFHEYVDEYVEEENEDEIEVNSDGYFQFSVDEDVEIIESENQNLLLDQLAPNKYVIVALKSTSRLSEFVAKINIIDNENEISVDFLEQNEEFKDKFRYPYKLTDIDKEVTLGDIVMLLPDPDCIYRSGVTFPKRINLKNYEIV